MKPPEGVMNFWSDKYGYFHVCVEDHMSNTIFFLVLRRLCVQSRVGCQCCKTRKSPMLFTASQGILAIKPSVQGWPNLHDAVAHH
jgi:hypothetical protein